jgi:hypothetical protein
MMDKYHEIDKWASELCGSQHDGECCENCNECDECEEHQLKFASWCEFWERKIGADE